MDEEQRFAFDTWGFLVVDGALTSEQVSSLKKTVDIKGPDLGSQHADRGGFWSQEFFDLLDVPSISVILTEIYGAKKDEVEPPYRIDHINIHTHGTFNKDLAGGTIHGRNERLLPEYRPCGEVVAVAAPASCPPCMGTALHAWRLPEQLVLMQ